MILRIELPKPLPKDHVCAQGITVYLDGKRIYRVNSIDSSISKYSESTRWIDKRTCEINGEFELRENRGLIDIYGI